MIHLTAETITDAQIREFLRDVSRMDDARHCMVALGLDAYDHSAADDIVRSAKLSSDRVMGRRATRTVLALLKQKMLQHTESGGLEISQLGRETAQKLAAKGAK
jgi:hypothetical protein